MTQQSIWVEQQAALEERVAGNKIITLPAGKKLFIYNGQRQVVAWIDSLGAASFIGGVEMGTTKDGGPGWTTSRGVAGVPLTSADATAAVACTDAPTAGQKLVITDLILSVNADMTVTFEEETSGTDVLPVLYPKAGAVIQITIRPFIKLPTAGKKMTVKASVAGAISVLPFYFSEA